MTKLLRRYQINNKMNLSFISSFWAILNFFGTKFRFNVRLVHFSQFVPKKIQTSLKRSGLVNIAALIAVFGLISLGVTLINPQTARAESLQQVVDSIDLTVPNASNESAVQKGFDLALTAAASLSSLFIVIGGLKYVLSYGDPGRVEQAKETILYAIIGLVVSMSAFVIVRYVLGVFN